MNPIYTFKPPKLLIASLLSLTLLTCLSLSAFAQTEKQTTEPAEEPGLVIVRVGSDSPAATAGIQRGDILLSLNGQETNTVRDLSSLLGEVKAGDTVTATLLHGDDKRKLAIVTEDRNGRAFLGITPFGGQAIMNRIVRGGRMPGMMPGMPGMMPGAQVKIEASIVEVLADSPAEKAGLEVGDIISAVDDKPVEPGSGLRRIVAQHKPGDPLVLAITRGEGDQSSTTPITVTLGSAPNDAEKAYLGVKVAIKATAEFNAGQGGMGGGGMHVAPAPGSPAEDGSDGTGMAEPEADVLFWQNAMPIDGGMPGMIPGMIPGMMMSPGIPMGGMFFFAPMAMPFYGVEEFNNGFDSGFDEEFNVEVPVEAQIIVGGGPMIENHTDEVNVELAPDGEDF